MHLEALLAADEGFAGQGVDLLHQAIKVNFGPTPVEAREAVRRELLGERQRLCGRCRRL